MTICSVCKAWVDDLESHLHDATGAIRSIVAKAESAGPVVETALSDAALVATALGQPTVGALLQSFSDAIKAHEQRLALLESQLAAQAAPAPPGAPGPV